MIDLANMSRLMLDLAFSLYCILLLYYVGQKSHDGGRNTYLINIGVGEVPLAELLWGG